MKDFQDTFKAEGQPLFKKFKIYAVVAQRAFGGNPDEFTISVGYAKMADLDLGPALQRHLGAEAYDKYLAKYSGMAVPVDRTVRRKVADLSF